MISPATPNRSKRLPPHRIDAESPASNHPQIHFSRSRRNSLSPYPLLTFSSYFASTLASFHHPVFSPLQCVYLYIYTHPAYIVCPRPALRYPWRDCATCASVPTLWNSDSTFTPRTTTINSFTTSTPTPRLASPDLRCSIGS